jgi:Chaperone of endosialidase
MKHLISLLGLFFFACALSAQAPNALNYQGVARNANGTPVANQNIRLRLSVLTGNANGNTVYQETHNQQTNQQGLYSTLIGTGTVLSGNFSAINWDQNQHYLRVEIDPNGGNSFEQVGTPALLASVPYALEANHADFANQTALQGDVQGNSQSNTVTGLQNLPVSATIPSNGQVLKWNGSEWAPAQDATSGGGGGGGFSLPYAGQTNTSNAAFQVTNTGSGPDAKFGNGGSSEIQLVGNTTWVMSTGVNEFGIKPLNSGTDVLQLAELNTTIHSEGTVFEADNGNKITFYNDRPSIELGANGSYIGLDGDAPGGATVYIQGPNKGLVLDGGDGAMTQVDGFDRIGTRLSGSYLIWDAVYTAAYQGPMFDMSPGSSLHTFEPWGFGDANLGAFNYPFNTVYTQATVNPSDRRLKERIMPIQGGLSRVMQMKPVEYYWKNPKSGDRRQLGFIAQELETVVPEVVEHAQTTTEELEALKKSGKPTPEITDRYGVNYTMLIPVLTQAIQEQQAMIEQLRQQNELLQQRVKVLEEKR